MIRLERVFFVEFKKKFVFYNSFNCFIMSLFSYIIILLLFNNLFFIYLFFIIIICNFFILLFGCLQSNFSITLAFIELKLKFHEAFRLIYGVLYDDNNAL